MKVAVYYDDVFKAQFPSTADTRVEAIMAIVDEMYSEKDTLTTEIEVNTIAIVHQSGYNWGNISDWGDDMSPWSFPSSDNYDLSGIAIASPHDANLYVFLSGQDAQDGLGLARLDALCDTSRYNRVSMNKYAPGDIKGGDAYTAEVNDALIKIQIYNKEFRNLIVTSKNINHAF